KSVTEFGEIFGRWGGSLTIPNRTWLRSQRLLSTANHEEGIDKFPRARDMWMDAKPKKNLLMRLFAHFPSLTFGWALLSWASACHGQATLQTIKNFGDVDP